jgi:hypothetical protein
LPSPICHHTTPPSFLHIYHLLISLLYQLYTPQSSAIPDTSTCHYNSRTTPKHKGPKAQQPPYHCPHF